MGFDLSSLVVRRRDIAAVALVVFLCANVAHCHFGYLAEKPKKMGSLLLPGAGQLIHEFTMPVSGAFEVVLREADEGKVEAISGDAIDTARCTPPGPAPEIDVESLGDSPKRSPDVIASANYFTSIHDCKLFERFGVITFDLFDVDEKVLIGTRYNPGMWQTFRHKGTAVADFRPIKKGTRLRLEITSLASPARSGKERSAYRVELWPIDLSLRDDKDWLVSE